LIKLTISDLILSNSLINHLAILSLNEELQDLNTKDLNCLLVNVLLAQLYLLLQTTTQSERKLILLKSTVTN
jgi:immunoglobulin-binding protein 1